MAGSYQKIRRETTSGDLRQVSAMLREEPLRRNVKPADDARMPIGQVVSVTGASVLIMLDLKKELNQDHMPRLGSMICIETGTSDVVASVAGLSSPTPGLGEDESSVLIAEVELIGEFHVSPNAPVTFSRGVSTFPALGDIAAAMSVADHAAVYGTQDVDQMRIGHVSDAGGAPARLDPNVLLGGNFALFGAAGAGKSCATAVLIRSLIKSRHPARILLVDPHAEFDRAFGKAAHVMRVTPGMIGHWMLTFRELRYLFEVSGEPLTKAESDVLGEAICAAKKRFIQANPTSASMRAAAEGVRLSVDTPIPYRFADVSMFIDRVAQAGGVSTDLFSHLKARIDNILKDSSYRVIFGSVAAADSLPELLGDVFRIPKEAKPITVLQIGDHEPAVCEVIVSAITRYAKIICEAQKGVIPLLLLFEEAHRYLPTNVSEAPVSTRSIMSVLDKSTKLSVSIGLVTSRLRALSSSALEHCDTMLAMRLPSRADQDHLFAVAPEAATGVLANVGVIEKGECIAVGPAAPVPMRLSFLKLPPDAVPHERSDQQAEKAQGDLPPTVTEVGAPFIDALVEQWRFQRD